VKGVQPKFDLLLEHPLFRDFSLDDLQRIGLILAELVESISTPASEEEFLQQTLKTLSERLGAAVFLAISDSRHPEIYRVKQGPDPDAKYTQIRSHIDGLLGSGIDSIFPEILESLPDMELQKVTLVRSPHSEPERILITTFGSKEPLAKPILTLAEPMIRIRLQAFRSQAAQERGVLFLKGIHETSRRMLHHLLSQSQLLAILLEDSRQLLRADSCAVLIPTDETHSDYVVQAQFGFGEHYRPIPVALFSQAFLDYELNERSAIFYRAGEKEVWLLVPLTQRQSVGGILLFSGKDVSFQNRGDDWRRVAEMFGDFVSIANETAILFDRFAASQSEWENTFDSIADPIYIIDNEYRLKKINKSLSSYAMKSIKMPMDPQCFRYLFNLNSICPWCPVPKSLETGMPESMEAPLFTGGTWQIQAFPYTEKDENRRGSINVLRDITVLNRMQEQLIETEKLASAGKLISGVAHEVRNPLFGISATVRALANELKEKQDIQPYLDIIMSETTRLNRLMEDLLNYTRPVKIDKNPSDLIELINEVIEHFQHLPDAQNAQLNVIAGDKIPAMNMDRNKMKQVLVNLLENGIQHAKEDPRIDIFLQYLSLADPPEVSLVIKDNGTGITTDNLTKVFDPFFTTRQKGTGLGLSIVRKVIHDHGGRIAIESHPGIGTTFRITLPLAGART
jgi:two-component system, NtrC family, sensor kinase